MSSRVPIRAHFETNLDRVFYIIDRLVLGLSLTYATGNRRAFRDPDGIFVPFDLDIKDHKLTIKWRRPILRFNS